MMEFTASTTGASPDRRTAQTPAGVVLVAAGVEAQHFLEMALSSQGFAVRLADTVQEFREFLRAEAAISFAVLDQEFIDEDVYRAIRHARKNGRDTPAVILVSGDPGKELPPEILRDRNSVVLRQPVFHGDLQKVIAKFQSAPKLAPEPRNGARSSFIFPADSLNPQVRRIARLIEQAALCEVPVLVQGETGAGKETLVRAIHGRSARAGQPFVNINCAALPRELVESQLFGYERGAFTGAYRNQPGLFEVADGGTIFLDEIGDMDIRLQAKLLQVLQDQEFHPLGSSNPVKVDVRVMAATHRDLDRAVAAGRLRADLFYRLNVISITIPPLRDRRSEILPLAEFLLEKHSAGLAPPPLDGDIRRLLLAHNWPGNVRELENMMRRYLVLRDVSVFDELRAAEPPPSEDAARVSESPARASSASPSIFESLDQARNKAQIDALLAALAAAHWNRKRAADLLRVDYKSLLYQMKKFGIGDNHGARSKPRTRGQDPLPGGTAFVLG